MISNQTCGRQGNEFQENLTQKLITKNDVYNLS